MDIDTSFLSDEPSPSRAAELRAIAARLVEMANALDRTANTDTLWLTLATSERHHLTILSMAEAEFVGRRKRERFVDRSLLGEPGWDMLLDLFIQEAHRKRVSISSVCKASGVHDSTAQRWLALLEAEGLVERDASTHDRRVKYVRLTDHAKLALSKWLHYRSSLAA